MKPFKINHSQLASQARAIADVKVPEYQKEPGYYTKWMVAYQFALKSLILKYKE